jgi:hypothetical protein
MKSSSKHSEVIVAHVSLEIPAADISRLDINAIKKFNFLWYLPILDYKLAARRDKDDTAYLDFLWRLSALPYSLRSTYNAYTLFMVKQRELIEKYKNIDKFLMLEPSHAYEVCFAIDQFLESAIRTQNAISSYLRAALGKKLPYSFHHLIIKMMKGTHTLPPAIHIELTKYWDNFGKRLRLYRDLSQHHALVASDIEIFRTADDIIGIKILLPSNPEVKDSEYLVWGSPEIHAQKFLTDQFFNLLGMTFVVTKMLAETLPGERKQMLGCLRRNPIIVGGNRKIGGHRPYSNDEIEENILTVLKQLDQKKLPPIEI